MNWYKRDEKRYVDYGISFPASRKSGVITVLKDLVYRINQDTLGRHPDFFESENAGSVAPARRT